MGKDSIVQKLTSRKFWCAVAGFVTTLLTALNVSSMTIEQVVTIIGGVGLLVAFIWGESKVDASREGGETIINKGTEVTHIYPDAFADTDKPVDLDDDKPPDLDGNE